MDKIRTSLIEFYNNQYQKFSNTRRKNWKEFDYILDYITNYDKKNIKILELGCGDGRFYNYLLDNKYYHNKTIKYTGVDISSNLVYLAKSNNNSKRFYVDDMINFVESQKTNSYDFVVSIASVQHIPTFKERLLLFKNVYRILSYGGYFIMLNRAFSKRFIKKYWYNICKSFFYNLFYYSKLNLSDVYIPWKGEYNIFQRYYHMFLFKEIKKLSLYSGFVNEELNYVDDKGNKISNGTDIRNSFFVGRKDVFKN